MEDICCCLQTVLILPILLLPLFLLADALCAATLVLATIGLTQSLDTTGQVRAKEKWGGGEFECIWSTEEEENRASV